MDRVDAIESEALTSGEVRFVEGSLLSQLRGPATAAGMLFAELLTPGPPLRGQLGEFLEAAVEEQLTALGADAPGVDTTSNWTASLTDQALRARRCERRGIVLALGPLDALVGPDGALDPDDSAALRAWAVCSSELPITLLLDRRNRGLCGYGPPIRIEELLGLSGAPARREQRPASPSALASAPPVEAAPVAQDETIEASETAEDPHPDEPLSPEPPVAIDATDWRRFADELHAARGPKPLPVVERMFASRYVPLAEAELLGLTDAFAKQVRAEWASSFAKSYSEAFKALGVTGKRPSMVFDVPQMAARIARLHGARSVELFLVDGMRFDLGLRVHARVRRAFEGKAACADQLLLWSALPTTTPVQLELLAHGIEGLSRQRPEECEASAVTRGRAVVTPRRVKIGQRDVMKLDVVEPRLRENGPALPERLEAIADDIARAIIKHAATLPDRSLLLIFGDHGFLADSTTAGSGPARSGGASPEEVLVPGFAWLLGGVH